MDFDFDFSSLDFLSDTEEQTTTEETQDPFDEFLQTARISHKRVLYQNARELAERMDYNEDYFAIVAGSFVFGDFIEALCEVNDLQPECINVSTLGMGKRNVDNLTNLYDFLGAVTINLVVSGYFVRINRRKEIVPYLQQACMGRNINVGVCATHTKIATIRSHKGNITVAGSANLSSASTLEQFQVIHDPGVFDFCNQMFDYVMSHYRIVSGIRGKSLLNEAKYTNDDKQIFEKLLAEMQEDPDINTKGVSHGKQCIRK